MFIYAKWNSSTTYGFGNNERDFGTDYGICCWYTPQLNFSAIPDGKQIVVGLWMRLFSKFRNFTSLTLQTKFGVNITNFSSNIEDKEKEKKK